MNSLTKYVRRSTLLRSIATLLLLGVGGAWQLRAQAPRLWDVTISLYSTPLTDAERAPYEAILRYFADGVFESSNGAHKIRRVTIHTTGDNATAADVVWVQNCHPNAFVAGRGTSGLYVNFCDNFSGVSFIADDFGAQGGGYALAHEWGHFFYSLYDEYVGDPSYDTIFTFPHSTDTGTELNNE